ncbi:MAG: FAD-dependent monooxygenase [Sciscionella sp.]
MRAARKVLVVGGGIGGLSAAIALVRREFDVEVIEAKERFDEPGVGLGQPANSLRALRALGVLDEVLTAGYAFDALDVYDHKGEFVVGHTFRMGGDVPAFAALPHATLHGILLAAVRDAGVRVRMGTRIESIIEHAGMADAAFTDGSGSYDLIAGFDGIRSATRRLLFGDAHGPTFTGFGAWRIVVPRPDDVTTMRFYQGVGNKTGVMPLTAETMYLFHVCPEQGNPRHDAATMHQLLSERLTGYGGVIGDVARGIGPSSRLVYSPIETLFVPAPWYAGHVVIAGDAAHVVPPHFTEGAGMAMEDAVALAESLADDTELSSGLGGFMSRRFERNRFVREFSTAMLSDEQGIVTEEQLQAAKHSRFGDFDMRLRKAYRVMDERVLDADPIIEGAQRIASLSGPKRMSNR